ncbi:MAG: protein-L-isoaspartate(D-aspartate) O-methyltransferase [Rhodospirillales bacterium]|nr:protein-L-isoaspartate(D-aspartate) O-methyltransferase [Rhodospirillales bacterium]
MAGQAMRPTLPGLVALATAALLLVAGPAATAADDDPFAEARAAMVRAVALDAERTAEWIGKEELSPRVMEAMGRVPRHLFVPPELQGFGYLNRPLPIGYGQTISQPYIVALMTDLLAPQPDDVAFELGTGSSYQAAVLAELVAGVYTVEIVEPLAASATDRLDALGYDNVTVRAGDGYFGWPEHAPFDIIVVTAAASHVPPPLIAQLKPGGRMVIPVGSPFLTQQLLLIEKKEDGAVTSRQILPVIFVPLTGGH